MRLPTTHSDATPAPGVSRRWPVWLVASLLGVLTVVLYWPATRNGFVNYDDDVYVTANPHVLSGVTGANIHWALGHQVGSNWHPLTLISHMLDCQLYGLNPWGHHLTSLLLHAGNAVLVFLLLWRLTGAQWRSLWVALFFACHPVHVESVAWVAERKDVLSGFFGLLALLFYAEFAGRQRTGSLAPAFYRCPYYWLAWFSFALGLLCKPMLVTWPCVLLLLDYWPLARFQPGRWRALVVEKIPLLILTVAMCLVTFQTQQQTGAMTVLEAMPLGMRGANALVSYGRYVGQWFWPLDLGCFYPHPGHWPVVWVLLAGAGLIGVTVWFWRQRERQPYWLVGWLWFVGTLVPVIGLVQVGNQAMADRYNYLPSIGLLVVIIWGIGELIQAGRLPRTPVLVAGGMAVLFCVALTERQIGYWQNSETLFRQALAVTHNNDIAHENLGAAYLERGEVAAAISEFEAAIQIKPQFAPFHVSLGNARFKNGEVAGAISEYQLATQLDPNNVKACVNLGCLLPLPDQADAAIGHFQSAIRIRPDYTEAYFNLGNVYLKIKRPDLAAEQYRTALQLQPEMVSAHYYLGVALSRQGQTDAAIEQFQTTLKLQPDHAGAAKSLARAEEIKSGPAAPANPDSEPK